MTISALGTLTESTVSTGQGTMAVSPTTVGNIMLLATTVGSASKAITAVTGGGADVAGWQRVHGAADEVNASVGTSGLWWARVGATGSQTITLTYSTSIASTSVERVWQEFTAGTGDNTTWTPGAHGVVNDTTTNGTISFPSLAATGTGELYVGYGATQNGYTSGATSGFTYQTAPTFGDVLVYNASGSGTLAPTASQSAGKSISFAGLFIAGVATGTEPLTETTGVEVPGRVLRVGEHDYDATIPTGSPDGAFLVLDRLNSTQDNSILWRSVGQQQWEAGTPGDDDFHIKRVTGSDESSHTYTDTLIVDYATGKVWIPTSLGVGTIPAERFHVIDLQAAGTALAKIENTATTGSEAAGVVLAGRSKSWTVATDVGLNGGDNLGISSDTAGYPPRVFVTPTAVGVGTDAPGAALDVNGAIRLAGDNSLSSLRLRGLKATAGAPTTGTYAVGDVVLDSAGAWWLCNTAGTPGTWASPESTKLHVLVHNGSAYPARPSGLAGGQVRYIGPVAPSDSLSHDEWVDNS